MFLLYTFAILVHGVLSIPPCKDGVEIVSQETRNPEDLLGNWTYVYHWDPKIKFIKEFLDKDDHPEFECPQLRFEPITPELVTAKEAECAKYKMPFNWADAKLRVDSSALKMNGGVITFGEKENWMAIDCIRMVRVMIKKVSDDYMVMLNHDKDSESELIAREPPTLEDLKCIAHNLDVSKGMSGLGVCYKQ